MVHDAAKILLAGVRILPPPALLQEGLRHRLASLAGSLVLHAHVLLASVLVVAENGETFGQYHDGVSLNDVTLGLVSSHTVKPFRILFVGHTGRPVVYDINLGENA
jgi:hypothetical protein